MPEAFKAVAFVILTELRQRDEVLLQMLLPHVKKHGAGKTKSSIPQSGMYCMMNDAFFILQVLISTSPFLHLLGGLELFSQFFSRIVALGTFQVARQSKGKACSRGRSVSNRRC